MAKVSGFLSQDVEETKRSYPGGPLVTTKIPPSWVPLLEKVLRWFDNQIYPVVTPFGMYSPRKKKQVNRVNTFLSTLRLLWNDFDSSQKAAWSTAAAFVKRSGYQLFVKDTCFRIKTFRPFPRAPSSYFAMYGLVMKNPGGATNVRLQRDDVNPMGQVTLSFNYKKIERNPTPSVPFKAVITLWYFEGGENKTETHVWEAPAGNVAWSSVSETYGMEGRQYFHHRVIFYLDSYDADVFLANFLITDHSLAWTVVYEANTFPELDVQPWVKTGGLSTIYVDKRKLFLEEVADSANQVEYDRTPSFSNPLGSSVKFRLKIEEGTEKDSGNDEYTFRVVHSDGTKRVEYLFYQNGIIIKIGDQYHKYHYDTTVWHTYTSYIRGDRVYFYVSKTLAFRYDNLPSGAQEVLFGHYGRDDYPGKSVLSYLKYYQGADESPGEDIVREGWLFKAGEVWEVDNLYRKRGWTFAPSYTSVYFDVIYLG